MIHTNPFYSFLSMLSEMAAEERAPVILSLCCIVHLFIYLALIFFLTRATDFAQEEGLHVIYNSTY